MSWTRRAPTPKHEPNVGSNLSRAFFYLALRHRDWVHSLSAGFGLTPIQVRTLMHLTPGRPSRMSEVAQDAGCEPANLTGVIDKLEARGLVRRRAASDDRRIKLVAVTREGTATRRRIGTLLLQPAPWMSALSEDDQRLLNDILMKALAAESNGIRPAEALMPARRRGAVGAG